MIPARVMNADEANAALDHAAGKETVAGKGREGVRAAAALGLHAARVAMDTVSLESRGVFAGEIHQFRRGGLHPRGKFVAGDAAGDFRVADGILAEAVQVGERVETEVAHLGGDARRIREVKHSLALVAEEDAGIFRR
jgi:hypothetical protein